MNPFDPAIEKSVSELTSHIHAASDQCRVVPSVAQAISHVAVSVHCFYRGLRDELLRKILAGDGPNAKIINLLNPADRRDYSWDLIKQEDRKPLRWHPAAAYHKAFCDYVNWTLREFHGDRLGPLDTPFEYRTYPVGGLKLAVPQRSAIYTQGMCSGEVHLTYCVPRLEVEDIAIQSQLEELPLMKQLGGAGPMDLDYDLDYERFWQHYYCKDPQVWEAEYPALPFPTVIPREVVENVALQEDITIRLRNFVVTVAEDGTLSFSDAVIQLVRETWTPCGYGVQVCRPLTVLFRGLSSNGGLGWKDLPRPLQAVLHQIELVAGKELVVELTNPTRHTVKATVVNSRSVAEAHEGGRWDVL